MSINIETLRCSICKAYLSCTPIMISSAGADICRYCHQLPLVDELYRQFTLENVLGETSFPCCYKGNGCDEVLLFGLANEHEPKCFFGPTVCPLKKIHDCTWEGTVVQLKSHFSSKHYVADEIGFCININEDDVFYTLTEAENCVPFFVYLKYTVAGKTIRYSIRNCLEEQAHIPCNILLTNQMDPKYYLQFYSKNDLNMLTVLDMQNYFNCLNNPDCVTIKIIFKSDSLTD